MQLRNIMNLKRNQPNKPKVLYLFSGKRREAVELVNKKDQPDDHFYGMMRLQHYAVEGSYLELEDYFSPKIAHVLRKFLTIYFVHVPLFFSFFKYDVIFTQTSYGVAFIFALLRFFGIRRPKFVIYDFSLLGHIGERKTWKQKVFAWLIGQMDGIITISADEAHKLQVMYPKLRDRIQFVPFGTDLDFFTPGEDDSESAQILTVGFDPGRDYETLFTATKELGVQLVATRSRKIGSFENVPPHVRIEHFSWKDLVGEYQKSKIVVLPLDISNGVNEAMGCSTLVEAMGCGKPIVATRTPTTESYIENGKNGVLVEAKDSVGLRGAITELLQNETKRLELGRNARIFAEQNCDAELAAERMANFFKSL